MLIFLGFLEISSGFLGIFWDFLGSWLVKCMGFSPSDLPLDLFAHDFSDIWIRKSQYSRGRRGASDSKNRGSADNDNAFVPQQKNHVSLPLKMRPIVHAQEQLVLRP